MFSQQYEWTIKALKAGKHVLLEKPAGNTAEEAAKMFELAKEKNLVLLEAFHFRSDREAIYNVMR